MDSFDIDLRDAYRREAACRAYMGAMWIALVLVWFNVVLIYASGGSGVALVAWGGSVVNYAIVTFLAVRPDRKKSTEATS